MQYDLFMRADTAPENERLAQLLKSAAPAYPCVVGDLNPIYVATHAQLAQAIAELEREPMIGLDIETSTTGPSEERHLPPPATGIVSLIQIAAYGDQARQYIIDPLVVDVDPLHRLLANRNQRVAIQNAPYEYDWLSYHYGFVITNVLDTCRAWRNVIKPHLAAHVPAYTASRSNIAQLSWEVLAHRMDKMEQTSDWTRRPLSLSQARYAAWDVAILGPLAQATLHCAQMLGLEAQLADNMREFELATYQRLSERAEYWSASDMSDRVRAMVGRCRSDSERKGLLGALATMPIYHAHRAQLKQLIFDSMSNRSRADRAAA